MLVALLFWLTTSLAQVAPAAEFQELPPPPLPTFAECLESIEPEYRDSCVGRPGSPALYGECLKVVPQEKESVCYNLPQNPGELPPPPLPKQEEEQKVEKFKELPPPPLPINACGPGREPDSLGSICLNKEEIKAKLKITFLALPEAIQKKVTSGIALAAGAEKLLASKNAEDALAGFLGDGKSDEDLVADYVYTNFIYDTENLKSLIRSAGKNPIAKMFLKFIAGEEERKKAEKPAEKEKRPEAPQPIPEVKKAPPPLLPTPQTIGVNYEKSFQGCLDSPHGSSDLEVLFHTKACAMRVKCTTEFDRGRVGYEIQFSAPDVHSRRLEVEAILSPTGAFGDCQCKSGYHEEKGYCVK